MELAGEPNKNVLVCLGGAGGREVTPKEEADYLGHLKYEFDSLYVLTEMIQSRRFMRHPLDSFLLECCLAHFRVIWDFFYLAESNALNVRAFLAGSEVRATRPKQPSRLRALRDGVNSDVVHLGLARIRAERKAQAPTMHDIAAIREHVRALYCYFTGELPDPQKSLLVNPLAHKFRDFETL